MRQKLLLLCSQSVVFDSLHPHGLQHARLPFSFTISRRLLKLISFELVMPSNHLVLCHPLLLPSIFPSIRVFSSESGLHISGQSIGASTSASVPPMNVQDWFPLGLVCLISLQSKGHSRIFSNTTVPKHQFFGAHLLYGSTLVCMHYNWKNHSLTIWTCFDKVLSLLFNILSKFIIAFLPRSKHLLISWLQLPSAVI